VDKENQTYAILWIHTFDLETEISV